MPVFNNQTLAPNTPEDIGFASNYFSTIKNWGNRDGGIYTAPTRGEFNRFNSYVSNLSNYSISLGVGCTLTEAKMTLSGINLLLRMGINARYFKDCFNSNPNTPWGRRNSTGTDALQIIRTALNMYALIKNDLGMRAWKVDFVYSCRNEMRSSQDDVFRGRCAFRLNNERVHQIINSVDDPNLFWANIFRTYDELAIPNHRIINPGYSDRPVVRRQTRTQRESILQTDGYQLANGSYFPPTQSVVIQPVPVIQSERLRGWSLEREYLDRSETEEQCITSEQLSGMIRMVGHELSEEIRNTIYDLIMGDYTSLRR